MLSRESLTAGVAFTIHSPAGESFAYRIVADGRIFSGPVFIARLDRDYGHVNLARGSRLTAGSLPYRVLRRVVARVWAGQSSAIEVAGWRLSVTTGERS
jgi:hypothetical protein